MDQAIDHHGMFCMGRLCTHGAMDSRDDVTEEHLQRNSTNAENQAAHL